MLVPPHSPTARIALPLVAWRVAFYGVVYFTLALLPTFFNVRNYSRNFHFPPEAPPTPCSTMYGRPDR